MIRRIELHNFATHQDTEIEFGNSKNIIIGQTGSGKTNLLQAVDFAFLGGEQGLNLEELIADGAENAEVVLDYMDPRTNQNYRIHRTLTRKAEGGGADHICSITNLETNETIRKPDPVRKTLEALGVETSVFRYVVHVPQGKFADVLQEGQDRKTVLDRLFKIAQLEETYHELGLQEGPIRKIQDRKEAHRLEKARLDGDASKLAEEQALYEKLTKDRQMKQQKVDDARKQYEQLGRVAPSIQEKLNKLDSLDSKVSGAKAIVQTSQTSIEALLKQLEGLVPDEIAVIETFDALRTRERLKKLEAELQNLIVERNAFEAGYTESVKRAASAKSQHTTAFDEQSAIEKQLQDISSYVNGKGEQPEIQCDKCGTLLAPQQWLNHIDEIKKKLQDAEKKAEQAKELWSNETLTGEKTKEKLDEAKAHVDNHQNAIGFVSQLVTKRENKEEAETSLVQLAEERKATIVNLRTLLENQDEADEEIVQKARMAPAVLEALPGQIEDSERELATYDDDILAPQLKRVEMSKEAKRKAEEELQPKIESDTKKIEMLQTIRTAFREIQPAVRSSFVARITASANDYLKRLYGGAEIENFEFSEDYEFLVTRAGHKRHAHRLSGGQQVLASMAFLMALSEVLSELDFLILDEPTTHLDENRRKELVNVLENLRRVPQLIIVDHHPELLAAADTRFQVTLNNEGQSQIVQMSD